MKQKLREANKRETQRVVELSLLENQGELSKEQKLELEKLNNKLNFLVSKK